MEKQQPVDDQLNSPAAPQAESLPTDSLPILLLEEWFQQALERGKAQGHKVHDNLRIPLVMKSPEEVAEFWRKADEAGKASGITHIIL